jgi:putative PEP-CTERM system histidine kinase
MMTVPSIGVVSHLIGAAAFLALGLVLLTGHRDRPLKTMLMFASLASAAWMATAAWQLHRGAILFPTHALELLRDFAWLAFLGRAVALLHSDSQLAARRFRSGLLIFGAAVLCLGSMTAYRYVSGHPLISPGGIDWLIAGHLVIAIVGLVLVEQLIRNARPESRRAMKYLCLGVGGLLIYDFYLYSDALLFQRVNGTLWQARGIANALTVPVIAVAVARDPSWSNEVYVSRRVVFHTAALLGTGIYLLAMGVGGYFVRTYGGNWGAVAQAVFLFGAALLLAILLFSGQLRAKLRVLINKHFFHYKYEYREEWLRFIETLTADAQDSKLRQRAIEAVGSILQSPAGLLWLVREGGRYECIAGWNLEPGLGEAVPVDEELPRFLDREQWVINLDEYAREPSRYGELRVPNWVYQVPGAWVVVPLILHDDLYGFMVLTRSESPHAFNYEDYDLLRTVGRQAAAHLAQLDTAAALTAAKQFEACSQLSAYVMHDLKNLIAQLSLVVSNASRHKHNPQFMEDAITTVENSVDKMSRLLSNIKGGIQAKETTNVDVCSMLADVVKTMSSGQPVPRLDCQATGLYVRCNQDRFSAVIGHVIRNAQDATPVDGVLIVRLFKGGEQSVIEVQDSGAGMSQEFIRDELFRPFVSTKGSGMGIGAYETREFVRGLGGDVEVLSRLGEGTTFRIRVPISEETRSYVSIAPGEEGRNPDDNKYKEVAGY